MAFLSNWQMRIFLDDEEEVSPSTPTPSAPRHTGTRGKSRSSGRPSRRFLTSKIKILEDTDMPNEESK